jgi:hypothetical protein
MIQEDEVKNRLTEYLSGKLSLEAFSDWLGEHSWNMHAGSSHSAKRLVGALELLLAEHARGHRTEPELRSLFSALQGVSIIEAEVAPSGVRSLDENSARVHVRPMSVAQYSELLVTV